MASVAIVDAGFFIGRRGRHWGPGGQLSKMQRMVAAGKRSSAQFQGLQRKVLINDMKYLEFRMREVRFFPSAARKIHICWDGVAGRNSRGTLLPTYKSERAGRMGLDLDSYDASTHQIHDFRDYISSLGFDPMSLRTNWISHYEAGLEADDLIAIKVQEAIDDPQIGTDDIWVFSGDTDLWQLFAWDDRIRIHNFVREIPRTEITDKLGIPLEHYALLKSITGDTADSIKGIPNIGPKSAATLIKTHGADLITNDLLLRWYNPEPTGLERISELLKAYRQNEGLTQKSCVENFGSIWRDLERGTERRLHYTEYQPIAEAVPEIRTHFTYQAHAETVARNLRLITLPFQLV